MASGWPNGSPWPIVFWSWAIAGLTYKVIAEKRFRKQDPKQAVVWAGGVKKGQNLTRFSANFHSMSPVLEGWKFGDLEFLDKKFFLDWFRDARECFKVFSCASAKWYLIRYHLSLFFPNASSYPKSEGTLWSKTFDFTYSVVFKKPFRGSLSCLNRNLF